MSAPSNLRVGASRGACQLRRWVEARLLQLVGMTKRAGSLRGQTRSQRERPRAISWRTSSILQVGEVGENGRVQQIVAGGIDGGGVERVQDVGQNILRSGWRATEVEHEPATCSTRAELGSTPSAMCASSGPWPGTATSCGTRSARSNDAQMFAHRVEVRHLVALKTRSGSTTSAQKKTPSQRMPI